jgi:hypothetical protein
MTARRRCSIRSRARTASGVLTPCAAGAILFASAVLTAAPVLSARAPTSPGARAGVVALPLTGAWETIANGDRINKILLDGDEIWSATDHGGVVRWNRANGAWRQYLSPQDGLVSNVVSDVVKAADGVVWVATALGLSRYDSTFDWFETLTPANSPGMPARVVTAVAPTGDGKLWVGFSQEWDPVLVDPVARVPGAFRKGGLARYDPATRVWDEEHHVKYTGTWSNPKFETLPSENISELAVATDGILWIATDSYLAWNQSTCTEADCPEEPGYWVPLGGGLVAKKGAQWMNWNPAEDKAGGCYPTIIRDFAPDHDGWMWAATSEGLFLMRNGVQRVGCGGMIRYTRARTSAVGMRGNQVFSVDVDAEGHVWVGHGESRDKGVGLGILDYGRSVDDWDSWDTDDYWEFIDLDGQPGISENVITALRFDESGKLVLGTRNHKRGDGDGLRVLDPAALTWTPLRTAADGLPGNQISDVKRHPSTGDLWVATAGHGVGRFDGQHWTTWRMFASARQVASTLVEARKGIAQLPVDIPDKATYDRLFPTHPRYVRLGDDATMYRITSYTIASTSLRITPPLVKALPKGSRVLAIDRGPASDDASQIAFDVAGNVWVGGRETVWQSNCADYPYCWLDGGLGMFDGTRWTVYSLDPSETGLVKRDREVESVEVDARGRVWAGTGNPFDSLDGKGIFVLDPTAGTWTLYDTENVKAKYFAGDGIGDMALDSATGDMWVAQHSVEVCARNSPFGDQCSPSFVGGGVSHFNGSTWEMWTKKSGAKIKAAGSGGNIRAIAIDRVHGRVWAGGFDEGQDFHWRLGRGVNAVINWCPLTGCTNDAWQSQVWTDAGEVAAIEVDDIGNVWVGTHRDAVGDVPPTSGIKIFDGSAWHAYATDNTGLPSQEITALERDGDTMWVGTLRDGLSRYLAVTPTPTPRESNTPRPTATPTRTPTDEPTPTAGIATAGIATAGPSPTATRTATRVPSTVGPGECGHGGIRCNYLPFLTQRRLCGRNCPTATRTPGGAARTPTRTPAVLTATSTPRV